MIDIGQKATVLKRLKENGLAIPDFFIIGSEYLSEHLKKHEKFIQKILRSIDYENRDSINNASEKIANRIRLLKDDLSLEEEVKRNIFTTHFSIRSSSSAEDGEEVSFAGQFQTFLHVKKNDVFHYVIECFAAIYSPNVLAYCHNKYLSVFDIKMSIIVQKMIPSDLSGIAFSANPQGLLNEVVIVCGKGTGDAVVEDRVPTTTYYYNTHDKVYYFEREDGAPLMEEGIFDEILKNVGLIEKIIAPYVDVEYAVYEGKLYILQARPITTLHADSPTILDNSNIVESYPGITLPLTDSFLNEAYYGVFRNLSKRILGSEKKVQKYENILRNMVGTANGRVYYKISNWYAVIQFLPFSKKLIPIWQDMMGVRNKDYGKSKNGGPLQRIQVYFNSFKAILTVTKEMERLNEAFLLKKQLFEKQYRNDLSNKELVSLYKSITENMLSNWDVTLVNDNYAFIFTSLLKNELKKLGVDNYEEMTNLMISGISNIESAKPIKGLIHLADIVCQDDSLRIKLEKLKDDGMVNAFLSENKSALCEGICSYIKDYGDRSLCELKLESKTFRSSPILLIGKILEYANNTETLLQMKHWTNTNDTDARSTFVAKKEIPADKRRIRFYMKKAMMGIQNREISRMNRSRIYGMVRTLFLSIGRNLSKNKIIDKESDVFYLYMDELFQFIEDKTIDIKTLIDQRKLEYQSYEKLPAYSRLVFEKEIWNKTHHIINGTRLHKNEKSLIGTPCSSGVVIGEVIVIDDLQNIPNVKGKIIVTKMTDPGWVFLLALAKGIIVEKGSLLSHTAIISRELHIPSVVGVKHVTDTLKTQDMVRLNGNTGEIEIIDSEKSIT